MVDDTETVRQIMLERQQSVRTLVRRRGDCFRLVVTASHAAYVPTAIFLHQQQLVDPATGRTADEFVSICSPFDLSIYPETSPTPGQLPAFFRKSSIDIVVASQQMLESVWELIQVEVGSLVWALDRMDRLEVADTVNITADAVSIPTDSISD